MSFLDCGHCCPHISQVPNFGTSAKRGRNCRAEYTHSLPESSGEAGSSIAGRQYAETLYCHKGDPKFRDLTGNIIEQGKRDIIGNDSWFFFQDIAWTLFWISNFFTFDHRTVYAFFLNGFTTWFFSLKNHEFFLLSCGKFVPWYLSMVFELK